MMGYYGSGIGFFGMSLGWLFMVLFWGLVIGGVVAMVLSLTKRESGGSSDAALDILRARYAKGEISKEEFEARQHDLQK